jgi:hypothetical protein
MTEQQEHIDDATASELTLYVDGRLPEERRTALEARIAASPELAAQVEEQRSIAARLDAAAGAVGAPARLRARVEADRRPARRRALAWTGAVAAAAAAAAVVVVLALPSGSPGGPSLAQAARLGELPPTEPAPRPASPSLLDAAQDGVPFPRWRGKFGWVAVGARTAKVDGRTATTVYYRNPKTGRTAAYTIVGGKDLGNPAGAAHRKIKGTDFSLPTFQGGPAVVWERGGHTCILQGTAPQPKLLQLASWRGAGTIPF